MEMAVLDQTERVPAVFQVSPAVGTRPFDNGQLIGQKLGSDGVQWKDQGLAMWGLISVGLVQVKVEDGGIEVRQGAGTGDQSGKHQGMRGH